MRDCGAAPEQPKASSSQQTHRRSTPRKRALIDVHLAREALAEAVREDDESALRRAVTALDNAMRRAVRVGLAEDPEIASWVRSQRSLGNRKGLRAARAGVERGVRPPMTSSEVALFNAVEDCRDQGLSSFTDIQRRLERNRLIPRMQRVQFNRLLERLGLKERAGRQTFTPAPIPPDVLRAARRRSLDAPEA